MSINDVKDFKSGDIKALIKNLENKSSSLDEIKFNLKTLINLSLENEDFVAEMLENGVVEGLVSLFNSSNEKMFQGNIATLLVSFLGRKKDEDENCIVDIVVSTLSNMFLNSDLNVFLQCLSGIKDIVTTPQSHALSSSSSSSSPTSPPRPLSLSLYSSTMLFAKATTLLDSTLLTDRAKQDVLDIVVQIVDTGVLNEASLYAEWCESQRQQPKPQQPQPSNPFLQPFQQPFQQQQQQPSQQPQNRKNNSLAEQFTRTFDTFTEAVKKIFEGKKRSTLVCGAQWIYKSIQEKNFFPKNAPPS